MKKLAAVVLVVFTLLGNRIILSRFADNDDRSLQFARTDTYANGRSGY